MLGLFLLGSTVESNIFDRGAAPSILRLRDLGAISCDPLEATTSAFLMAISAFDGRPRLRGTIPMEEGRSGPGPPLSDGFG